MALRAAALYDTRKSRRQQRSKFSRRPGFRACDQAMQIHGGFAMRRSTIERLAPVRCCALPISQEMVLNFVEQGPGPKFDWRRTPAGSPAQMKTETTMPNSISRRSKASVLDLTLPSPPYADDAGPGAVSFAWSRPAAAYHGRIRLSSARKGSTGAKADDEVSLTILNRARNKRSVT